MLKIGDPAAKILKDLERHLLRSSDFEQYAQHLLEFLCKKVGAQTVFLAFFDPEKRLEQNPLVFGSKPAPALLQNLSRAITQGSFVQEPAQKGKILCEKILLHKSTLGWLGVTFVNHGPSFKMDGARWKSLCESLKRDIYFIREQMARTRRIASLNTLYRINEAVSETLNLDKLLASIVESAKKLLNAEASSLAVVDPTSGELVFTVAKGPKARKVPQKRMRMGQGIIGAVAQTGKPLIIQDAQKDKRFFREMDAHTGFKTRSILCVPMKVRNNIVGALEVLNPVDRDAFTQDQIPPLSALAQEAAVSIENARLFHAATTDGLTGLATIRYFRSLLENEMSRAARYAHPLSLIMLDIDFFKKVNDTYGHPAGDLILKELARMIRDCIRQIDVAGRYGGEEFILLLPECPAKEAMWVAERIRQKVQNTKIVSEGRSYSITVSLGVAGMRPGDDMTRIVARADQKLYEAKNSGRNRVCG